jgi:hypothetical protein
LNHPKVINDITSLIFDFGSIKFGYEVSSVINYQNLLGINLSNGKNIFSMNSLINRNFQILGKINFSSDGNPDETFTYDGNM